METCKHGLGAGIRKPTAEMRQGAGCRAYNFQGRHLLYLSPCGGTAEQAVFGLVYDSDLLSGTGKLPFSLYGCVERWGARPVDGANSFGKNPPYPYDFATTLLGNDR